MDRIKELVKILNEARMTYEQEDREIMSNLEYDKLYDELLNLEKLTGIVLADSPTINVGYEVLSELPKEAHENPMLSLDKTKEVEALVDFLGDKEGLISWKLDGLTIVLTYKNGELSKAITRGNGEIGEVVTNNAKTFKNLPRKIPFTGELIIRGEAVIKYSDFNLINEKIDDVDSKYKNPRNLCSGSVRQLNNQITAERSVNFFAFSLVKADGEDFENSRKNQIEWLKSQGFMTVEYEMVTRENVAQVVGNFAEKIVDNDLPSDGLVMLLDDIAYGESLGATSKFPRNSIAFKWADELAQTKLLEIEWSASRTGLVNPIAIFEPVELEGTTVARASLHNLSILESLALGVGDTITVYKANMIIPQIADNITRSGVKDIPEKCPVCGTELELKNQNGVKSLYCPNPECPAKKIKLFSHFVSRNAMNIEGLSEETLDKFIGMGLINEFYDIYHLDRYENQIVEMRGFGRKSYDNIITSVNVSRKTDAARVLFSLGILNIGLSNAKLICREYGYDIEQLRHADKERLLTIDGIGEVIADAFTAYFSDQENNEQFDRLINELEIEIPEINESEQKLDGKTFVITGSLEHFENRDQAKEKIESLGGKVTGSVTAKTDYLINNDVLSSSSKNKKAKDLGVQIISEEDFLKLID